MPAFPSNGNDDINGTSGPDSIDALAGNDVVRGYEGNDTLAGGADYDLVQGGVGNDSLSGLEENQFTYDTLQGGPGNDTLVAGGHDRVEGGSGDDLLSAEGGQHNTLIAGAGNDTLQGSSDDTDGADYSRWGRALDVDLGAGLVDERFGSSTDVISNIDWFRASTQPDRIVGSGLVM